MTRLKKTSTPGAPDSENCGLDLLWTKDSISIFLTFHFEPPFPTAHRIAAKGIGMELDDLRKKAGELKIAPRNWLSR